MGYILHILKYFKQVLEINKDIIHIILIKKQLIQLITSPLFFFNLLIKSSLLEKSLRTLVNKLM